MVKVDDAVLSSYQQRHPDRVTPDTGYYVVTNNLNQAFYIIPRLQMKHLEQTYVATHIDSDPVLELRVLRVLVSCEFLSKPGRNMFMQELRRYVRFPRLMLASVHRWTTFTLVVIDD